VEIKDYLAFEDFPNYIDPRQKAPFLPSSFKSIHMTIKDKLEGFKNKIDDTIANRDIANFTEKMPLLFDELSQLMTKVNKDYDLKQAVIHKPAWIFHIEEGNQILSNFNINQVKKENLNAEINSTKNLINNKIKTAITLFKRECELGGKNILNKKID
jgi:hypothetical protein